MKNCWLDLTNFFEKFVFLSFQDDLFNHCEHPKDLDCKLESLTCSDPGCLNPEVEQVTEVEDKAVLGEPEAPEPTTEPTTTEKASHATESSNLNIADERK